ncbi:MAG TPA: YcaO-like family protein [Acidimicrobiales bacterium]|nr:YcaO-like family protein [Acidimicrobiales bacterium]
MTLDAAAAVARIGGVVSHVSSLSTSVPGWHLRIAHVGRGLHPDAVAEPLDAAAVSQDPADAELRAVMKGLERYAAAAWDPADFRWSSAEDFGEDAVPIADLAGVETLEPRDRIRWVEGWDLADGKPMWLPAVSVYASLPPAVEPEGFKSQSMTGCAAHSSLGPAVTRALLEVIERDAVAVARGLRRPLIGLAGADTLLGEVTEGGTDIALFDVTTEVALPVVLAVLRGGVAYGSAAGADPVAAASEAIAEALGAEALGRANRGAAPPVEPETIAALPADVVDTGDSVKLDELVKADVSKPALMSVLRDAGLCAYAVDLTCDELRDVGAVAVRVVVPGLLLDADPESAASHASTRLAQAARALGLEQEAGAGEALPR